MIQPLFFLVFAIYKVRLQLVVGTGELYDNSVWGINIGCILGVGYREIGLATNGTKCSMKVSLYG